MSRSLEYQLFVLVILKFGFAWPEEPFCCRQGQGLIKKKGSPAYCWSPAENLTEPTPLTCNFTQVVSEKLVNFTVNDRGQLLLFTDHVNHEPLEPGSFCVANRTTSIDVTLRHGSRAALFCFEPKRPIIDEHVFNYCMLVSVFFLLLTALVYALLPEMRDLQGKSIINFCISLALGLGLMAVMNLLPYTDMTLCAIKGFLAYFFMIAAFFWTNAIAVQILISIRRPTITDYGWSYFARFAVYAWGAPAALALSLALVNYMPGVDARLRPGIGHNHCWFTNRKQQWVYMYSVMSALIAVNVGVFAYASLLLWRHTFSSTHLKALRYKFIMTIRLFVIMGLPWVFEMISSLMDAHIIWVIMDLFNTLQGPLLFVLLVLGRRRTVRAARAHGWLRCAAACADRYLAAADDDEDNIVHHTVVSMDDRTIV